MGWQKDTGLGSKAQGIKDPVWVTGTNGSMGLGKNTEFAETAAAATQERRRLRSEQLLNETKEETEKRREEVATVHGFCCVGSLFFFLRCVDQKNWVLVCGNVVQETRQQTIAEVVRATISVFNCTLCKAQYTTGEQWEEHLSSYQHHHRVRFQETRRFHANKNMNAGQQERDELLADKALEAQMAAAIAADKQKLAAKAASVPAPPITGVPTFATAAASTASTATPTEATQVTITDHRKKKRGESENICLGER